MYGQDRSLKDGQSGRDQGFFKRIGDNHSEWPQTCENSPSPCRGSRVIFRGDGATTFLEKRPQNGLSCTERHPRSETLHEHRFSGKTLESTEGVSNSILRTFLIHNLETFVQDEAASLLHASREVQVHLHIGIDVEQAVTLWKLHIQGQLPSLPPFLQVVTGEVLGLQHELAHNVLATSDVTRFGKVEVFIPLWYSEFLLCHNYQKYSFLIPSPVRIGL